MNDDDQAPGSGSQSTPDDSSNLSIADIARMHEPPAWPIAIITRGLDDISEIMSAIEKYRFRDRCLQIDLRDHLGREPAGDTGIDFSGRESGTHPNTISAVYRQDGFARTMSSIIDQLIENRFPFVVLRCSSGYRADTCGRTLIGACNSILVGDRHMFKAIHLSHTGPYAADGVKSLVKSALMFIGRMQWFSISDTSLIGINDQYAFRECSDDQQAMINFMDFWTHVQNIRLERDQLPWGGRLSVNRQ